MPFASIYVFLAIRRKREALDNNRGAGPILLDFHCYNNKNNNKINQPTHRLDVFFRRYDARKFLICLDL